MDHPIDSTTNESSYSLFSIRQAAHTCNLSRSSLIRLEEKGMLTPAHTDAKTGYRYYDNNNISRILQIQKFQRMGFNAEEIISYYKGGGKADELLATLEQKLYVLQQQVEEMRLRSHNVPDMSLSIIELPETICCVRKFQGPLIQDKYHASYDFFHECVEKGISFAPIPFFSINERTDYLEGTLLPPPPTIFISVFRFRRNMRLIMRSSFQPALPFPCCFMAATAISIKLISIWESRSANGD